MTSLIHLVDSTHEYDALIRADRQKRIDALAPDRSDWLRVEGCLGPSWSSLSADEAAKRDKCDELVREAKAAGVNLYAILAAFSKAPVIRRRRT